MSITARCRISAGLHMSTGRITGRSRAAYGIAGRKTGYRSPLDGGIGVLVLVQKALKRGEGGDELLCIFPRSGIWIMWIEQRLMTAEETRELLRL